MVTLEQVTKLREYADISFEEAKAALEETNGDILEAIVNLEKKNRINAPVGGGSYSTGGQQQTEHTQTTNEKTGSGSTASDNTSFGEMVGRFLRWCGRVIHRGNINSFEVIKDGQKIMSVPVTVLVLLLILAFWLIIPLIIISLFFDYRYKFNGPDLGKEKVNKAMDSVADAAGNFKNDIKGEKTDGTHSDH